MYRVAKLASGILLSKSMNHLLIRSCSVLALLTCSTIAAVPPTPVQWESVVKAREQRVEFFRGELKAQDARIEARIGDIVTALKSITDSKDSRTKVTRMKEQTIDALAKNLEYFRQKREALIEELRRPTANLTPGQKRKGVAIFDARIEKRVGQIVALQKSFPTHKDYARYKATGTDWRGGTTYKLNEDHEQNVRLTARTNSQREELTGGLRKSIERLEAQNRALKSAGAPSAEIAKNDALIAERRKQIAAALIPVSAPARQIGQKEALALDQALQKANADLRREFVMLFGRYNGILAELQSLNTARAALAEIKK